MMLNVFGPRPDVTPAQLLGVLLAGVPVVASWLRAARNHVDAQVQAASLTPVPSPAQDGLAGASLASPVVGDADGEGLVDDEEGALLEELDAGLLPTDAEEWSFAFNAGEGALAGSTLLRELNRRDFDGVAAEFDRWTRAGGRVLPGLVRRRNAEEALFRAGALPRRWEGYTASERRWIEDATGCCARGGTYRVVLFCAG